MKEEREGRERKKRARADGKCRDLEQGHKITGLQYSGPGHKQKATSARLLVSTIDSRIRLYRSLAVQAHELEGGLEVAR